MQLPNAIAISTLVSAVVLATGAGVMMGTGPSDSATVANELEAVTAVESSSSATAFNIDKTRSVVIYKVRDLGVSNYYGRIKAPTGTFTLDRDNPENNSVVVIIDMKQMDSGDKNRDRLLLGPQYFNARQYPTATFQSTSITKVDDSTFEATGSFTMRGVTKEITVTVKLPTEFESLNQLEMAIQTEGQRIKQQLFEQELQAIIDEQKERGADEPIA